VNVVYHVRIVYLYIVARSRVSPKMAVVVVDYSGHGYHTVPNASGWPTLLRPAGRGVVVIALKYEVTNNKLMSKINMTV